MTCLSGAASYSSSVIEDSGAVALRAMSQLDVPDVMAIQEPASIVALASVFPQDEFPFPRKDVARRWREEIAEPGTECFVVLEGDAVVGFAAIRGDELLHFGVAIGRWGSGIAQQAHDALIDTLRHRGVSRAWLRVFTGNARGRAFYERRGWRPTGERTHSTFAPHPELLRYELDVERRVAIEVVPYRDEWAAQFELVAQALRRALPDVLAARIEHVGSTSVPGLAAKPILDLDVIVDTDHVPGAVSALEAIGYMHRGNLGVAGREAFYAPDQCPRRHVYVCAAGTLSVRNHLAVREVLRRRDDLRDEYAAVKSSLAANPEMDIETYLARKSTVLQKVLAESDLTEDERLRIWKLNDPSA